MRSSFRATATVSQTPQPRGDLIFTRRFTTEGVSPYDEVQWERRTASITDTKGNTIFEQKDVEVPVDWSMTATNIVASKYLHGQLGTPERETGVRQLVSRVAETIRDWGMNGGYFATPEDAAIFHDELAHMLLTQKVAFNSPVWFNVGCDRLEPDAEGQNWHWDPATGGVRYSATGYHNPQCSACFINSVDDSMDGIMDLARTEAMLFKFGSGTGTNFSSAALQQGIRLRRRHGQRPAQLHARLRRLCRRHQVRRQDPPRRQDGDSQRRPPGHRGLHRVQGQGRGQGLHAHQGRLRRLRARLRGLLVHLLPERQQLRARQRRVHARLRERRRLHHLHREGPPAGRHLQGARHHAQDRRGHLALRRPRHAVRHHHQQAGTPARTPARINASNPCSEYMFLDNSACNLASFNLMKYVTPSGGFDIPAYRHSISVVITAMEILVDNSGYPTEAIARNSHDYRPLGLGYANLGALLMAFGLPYDSAAGRDLAAALTAIMYRPGLPAVGHHCRQLPAARLGHAAHRQLSSARAAPAPASTSTASPSST